MDKSMKLVFTSFRDSIGLDGLKVAIDKHTPRHCSYPVLNYLVIPKVDNLSLENQDKMVTILLDNNWELLESFINDCYALGIRQIVFCDWCTKEQIENGKFCVAKMIGEYIINPSNAQVFEFEVEIEYSDGRELL